MYHHAVTLICGYRRTGKDSLFHILSSNSRVNLNNSGALGGSLVNLNNPGASWIVYKNPNIQHSLSTYPDSNIKYIRTAFADALKQEVSEQYNIPINISDSDKDNKQFTHYKTGELVSARDTYIEWGQIRRSQNLNYWCAAAFKPIPNEPNINCVVTDWRFPNELSYTKSHCNRVITARVYRSAVPEPPMSEISEHSLDSYATDFLLVIDGEFDLAVARFPQYSGYVMCEYL